MHSHPKQPFPPARLLAVAAALAAGTSIAACGASSPSGTSSSTAPGASTSARSSTSSTLAFSTCMRANGVPNFPDLGNSGMLINGSGQTISVNGVSVNAPAYQAARAQCQRYLPTEHASATQTAQQRQRGLSFAKCMRSRGVPNFPDPKVISSHDGNQVVYLPGINTEAPAFKAAAKACGGGPKGP